MAMQHGAIESSKCNTATYHHNAALHKVSHATSTNAYWSSQGNLDAGGQVIRQQAADSRQLPGWVTANREDAQQAARTAAQEDGQDDPQCQASSQTDTTPQYGP